MNGPLEAPLGTELGFSLLFGGATILGAYVIGLCLSRPMPLRANLLNLILTRLGGPPHE